MRSVLLLVLLLGGCGRAEERQRPLPPASAVAPVAGARLADALDLLDRELAGVAEAGLEDDGLERFARAEAITDRLLETRYPFAWLRAGSYSLDARLRQIQSLADRITAGLRSAAPPDSVSADLERLRRDVVQLREALALGGGPAPPPLERLLAGRDTLDLIGGEAGGE